MTVRTDYEPLDLSGLLNGSSALFEAEFEQYQLRTADLATDFLTPTARIPATGQVRLRGLPFLVGSPSSPAATPNHQCYVLFGPGGHRQTVRIEVLRPARWLVFAHVLLDTEILNHRPPGEVVAEYVVQLSGAEPIRISVRELFEIAIRPRLRGGVMDSLPWLSAASPFLARPDRFDTLHNLKEGPWVLSGQRLMETIQSLSNGYQLWAWRNPTSLDVDAIEVIPRHRPFLIAGITCGYEDEHPLVPAGPFVLRIAGQDGSEHSFRLAVDRGLASPVVPLPRASLSLPSAQDTNGWGEPINESGSPAYARVLATPSAEVLVSDGEAIVGGVRLRDLARSNGAVEVRAGVSVECVDRELTWVHATVVDDETGSPIPCRIHFRSEAGIPYQPHGHPQHVGSNVPSWNIDVGGDLRLGQTTYAYIDGRCQGWLPVGRVLVEATRGHEYTPLREWVNIRPGQHDLTLRLRRWIDLRRDGWLSGDTHVHFLSVDGAHLEASAEDVSVVNLLQAQWGSLYTNAEDWTGRPSVSEDRGTIVYVSQENRQHLLGHLGLLGLTRPVMPWSSDGPAEAELGDRLETTLARWADACREQGGTVVAAHFGYPNGELAALIATGRVDALEMAHQDPFYHDEYYRYLNAGYRLPLVGGTDKMSNETAVGQYRTYVRIPEHETFSYETWCRNLRAGRTFLSAGPLVGLEVDGAKIGDTLRLGAGGGTVEVRAWAASASPVHALQLVRAGQVVAETSSKRGTTRLDLVERVSVTADTWLAVRVGGPAYFDGPRFLSAMPGGMFAHSSPIYLTCGDDWQMRDDEVLAYMETMIHGGIEYIRDGAVNGLDNRMAGASVRHYPHGERDHVEYLVRPFDEALERLAGRRSKS